VVAGEVRSLAQRTTTAAREVKQLIEDSAERVASGVGQTDAARQTMGEALAAVQRMTSLVGEIDVGAGEQLTGISQVNDAVSHMDGLTQQNAALVEQLAAASVAVRGQAEAVAESVRIFRLDVRQGAGPLQQAA
jgi:aerotaxis receptor